MDAKCAHVASAEAKFTTSTKISVRGASEYHAEWVQGEAYPWQGGYIATLFEYRVENCKSAIIIKIVVIHAVIWAGEFLFSFCILVSLILWQSGWLELNLIQVGRR